jgi:predicted nucleic acid-binding protein
VPKSLFDTNIVQSKAFLTFSDHRKICFSSVVFCELMTACNDRKELKEYQSAWKSAREEDILIVPTEEDWLVAARIQFILAQERKQDAGGKSLKRSAKVKQELAMDCLIAASACREKVAVITNDNDFFAIQRHLKGLKLIHFS